MKKLIFISILLFAYLNGYCEGPSSEVAPDVSCAMELGQPDLIITSKSLNQSYVPCGILVKASFTVKNNGNAVAPSGSRLGFYLSTDTNWDVNDTYLSEEYVPVIAAGNSVSDFDHPKIPTNISNGTYYILFVADHSEVMTEISENNNVEYLQITVHSCDPLPDLVITNETIDERYVDCGESVYITSKVKNRDVANARSSRMGYYLSDDWRWNDRVTYLGRDYVNNLNPDATSYETQTVTIPAGTPSGIYWILFVADYQGVVTERVESNNIEAQWVSVTCGPGQKQSTDGGMTVNNYPSPFSESTTIEFDLPKDEPVTLFVSDMTGKQVAVLLNKQQQYAGKNQVTFDGSNYPNGMYYYTIQAGEYTATNKMILMR